MESDSDSSEEATFYSCSENFASDSDQDGEPFDPALPSFLASMGTPFGYTDPEVIKALVSINAARILLAEVVSADSLDPFRAKAILERILTICEGWDNREEPNFDTVLLLPLFYSSLERIRSERKPCSKGNIYRLITQMHASPSVAVIKSHNDILTILCVPSSFSIDRKGTTSYLIFNPQCRASPEMAGASLRYSPSIEDTIQHVYNITAIYRSVLMDSESSAPEYMYAGHIFVPPIEPSSAIMRRELVAQYLANTRLLNERRDLRSSRVREDALRDEVTALYGRIEAERMGEEEARAKEDTKRAEAVVLRAELEDVRAITAALLERQPTPPVIQTKSAVTEETDSEKVGQAVVGSGEEATATTESSYESLSNDTATNDSHRSETSTPPTSPEAPWSTQAVPSHQNAKPQVARGGGEDASIQEALRLEAQNAEEATSLALARKLAAEDRDTAMVRHALLNILASKFFECPLCLDRCQEEVMVLVEGCNHGACRMCMLDYVGGQVGMDATAAGKPIPCPVCPVDQLKKGVVTQTLAELTR